MKIDIKQPVFWLALFGAFVVLWLYVVLALDHSWFPAVMLAFSGFAVGRQYMAVTMIMLYNDNKELNGTSEKNS